MNLPDPPARLKRRRAPRDGGEAPMASSAAAVAAGSAAAPLDAPAVVAATLAVLDRLLAVAVDKTARLLGPATLLDPWRGMHLDVEDVRRALRGDRVAALHESDAAFAVGGDAAAALAAPILASPVLAGVVHGAALDPVDVAIAVVVLAPHVDLRYERIYGYLQDDIQCRQPAPDLIANLLGGSPAGRLQVLERFEPGAPLMRARVLQAGGAGVAAPGLGLGLRLSAPWLAALTRSPAQAAAPRAERPALHAAPSEVAAQVGRIVHEARAHAEPVRLMLQGPDGAGKFDLARYIAGAAGLTLRVVDLRACASAEELRAVVDAETLAARLQGGLPYLHGVARMSAHDPQLPRLLQDLLAAPGVAFVLSLNAPLPCVGARAVSVDRIELQWPDAELRLHCWDEALTERGLAVPQDQLSSVSTRFALSRAQIRQAAADLERELRLRGGPSTVAASDLAAAARRLCGDELARLAQRIRPAAGFEALVAAPEVIAQLREMCTRVALRDTVRRWCGDGVHRRANGINALFAGPSGTGKTLAAEIVAHALELDLFRIDLSAVVSKYIGETEKNLDRVFAAAEHANAVLFFDEAEALFGKRSEVKDAHDRYANIEIAYLLQKIEQFDGVAILATNLKQNLDDAFTRRLTFCINFAFPEEAERLRLWQTLWPAAARRTDEVDFAVLARDYKLSGGNIRNVVTAALYLAAADNGPVTREHLLHATRREYQKFGKTLGPVPATGERRAA
ncbi:ATP-binding protein [Schlegelella sp. S2-27]|uniref:ATP-binding protein n=1 Tax=Caldimonas mangrovi TaxID=2944811 RepID=A0ABT0YQE8_9BURK|nr:ATP-binding protein [Caldimonas mangrovi]MCM5680477.1 ATP-binding protein [Caldimonas mangrovi]